MALNALDTLAGLIHDANVNTVKVAVQCFATVYPLLFRKMYANCLHPRAIYLFAYTRVIPPVQMHPAHYAAPMGTAHADEDEDPGHGVGTVDPSWCQDIFYQVHAASYTSADEGG